MDKQNDKLQDSGFTISPGWLLIVIGVGVILWSLFYAAAAFADSTATSGSGASATSGSGSQNSFQQTFDSHNGASDPGRGIGVAVPPNLTTTLTETSKIP